MNAQGMLSVESKNIFSILKKWLYEEQDIVFRELISNAVDAIQKRPNFPAEEGRVRVWLDGENRLLIISDNGVGMSRKEVEKYINQIAFSGAEDFIRENDEAAHEIIGHFGVGFYSAFMLANHVAIETKSWDAEKPAVRWDCTTEMEYHITEGNRKETGTDVILYLEEGNPFLAKPTLIREAIVKYFAFSRMAILFEAPGIQPMQVSDPAPPWKNPASPGALRGFYREFFGDVSDPLFWISIVSADIGLQGMLFIRNTRQGVEELDGSVKIYCRGVYIGENIPALVPKFVNLQNGIIECDDLPLVVSRGDIRAGETDVASLVNECLSQEVAIAIHDMFTNRRGEYESFWPELNAFVKYGVMQDIIFASVMARKVIFMDLYGAYHTIGEYAEEGNVFYASDKLDQSHYIEIFKACQHNALLFDHVIDNPLMLRYETLFPRLRFIRIDSNIEEMFGGSLQDGDEQAIETLRNRMAEALAERLGAIELTFTRLAHQNVSVLILNDEKSRRMADMMEIYGYLQPDDFAAKEKQSRSKLLVNLSNPIVGFLLASSDEAAVRLVANQLLDLALMSQQALRAEDVESFIKRSEQLLGSYIEGNSLS